MAIFKFYQIYRGMKEVVGEEMAEKLFPEYLTLPDKMSPNEQAHLGKVIMNRLDESLSLETIINIRHIHPCNISKGQIEKIKELKHKFINMDDIIRGYSEFLYPGSVRKEDGTLVVSFGLNKCVCGMLRKLEIYETMPKSWCECCNGHVIKMYSTIFERPVSSEIVETIACGGKDCIFKLNIQ